MLQIVECPRDAMQGIKPFIATEAKIDYLNTLLQVGFDTLDFGSFVSPKAIPQMADTAQVLKGLNLDGVHTKLLAIVANERGASEAAQYDEVSILGYPFSISETFQLRNTNASLDASLDRIESISSIALKQGKELVIYLSMAFGNPYGDPWSPDIAISWSQKLYERFGLRYIALSDTIGSSEPAIITQLFTSLIPALPKVRFGAHLHTTPDSWQGKVEAAYQAGCRRFDGALKGFGGCPMAKDELTGNMPTELMLGYFDSNGIATGVNAEQLVLALQKSTSIFG